MSASISSFDISRPFVDLRTRPFTSNNQLNEEEGKHILLFSSSLKGNDCQGKGKRMRDETLRVVL